MTNKSWWTFIGILFALSLALRANAGPATVLFLFAILLSIASGASMLWYRFCLHGVTYRRKLDQERIFCGEETQHTGDQCQTLAPGLATDPGQFPQGRIAADRRAALSGSVRQS